MTENNTDLSEIMIYKDFHKERRHLVYYIFIYIIIYLTYIIFMKDKYHLEMNNKFLLQLPFSEFNNLLNNTLKQILTFNDSLVFDSGEINIPLLCSSLIFMYLGFKTPNNVVAIIVFNIMFQLILIFTNKSGNVLTYPLFNIFGYKIGNTFYDYFFGDKYR